MNQSTPQLTFNRNGGQCQFFHWLFNAPYGSVHSVLTCIVECGTMV